MSDAHAVRAHDSGSGPWFHVDVVLRPPAPADIDRLVEQIRIRLAEVETTAPIDHPQTAVSFDGSPPEGDFGVGIWVRAPTAGDAVDIAVHLAMAGAEALGAAGSRIWDLRVVPVDGVDAAVLESAAQTTLSARGELDGDA